MEFVKYYLIECLFLKMKAYHSYKVLRSVCFMLNKHFSNERLTVTAPNLCCMYEAPNYFGKTVVNPSSMLPKFFLFFVFFPLVAVRSLLIAMASLVAEHGL